MAVNMSKPVKDGVAKKATKYKKAPDAPKRFKSAFIIFSAQKHKKIKLELLEEGKAIKTTDIAKLVSEAWKKLTPEERKEWEAAAEKDKVRYEAEKAIYKGPWKIPSNKRKTKDPLAPKRPMSAFLAYSNSRRAGLKRDHPKSTNADLSRMLSKTWKELDPTQRAVYMAEERTLRDQYKLKMAEWRTKVATEKKIEREEREVAALKAAEAGPKPGMHPEHGMDTKWMGDSRMMSGAGMPPSNDQQQYDQEQQRRTMAQAQMMNNPYLQAAAFGGGGFGFNPAAGNPYVAANMNMGAFAGQGYMQGNGNPTMAYLGGQPTQQGGMQPGIYGGNFPGGGGGPGPVGSMNDGSGGRGAQYGHPDQRKQE